MYLLIYDYSEKIPFNSYIESYKTLNELRSAIMCAVESGSKFRIAQELTWDFNITPMKDK